MFRDLKEYQEIAKIYADKVSKPENLDERVRGGGVKTSGVPAPKPVTPPQGGAGGGVGNPTNTRGTGAGTVKPIVRGAQGRTRRPQPEIKKFPSTAEIRAKNPNAVGGGNAGASTDSGGTSQSTIKSVEQKPEIKKPVISTTTKQGKPRTKAQMMAAKRIAAGKSISDVKAENQAAMKAKAKERFAAFKAKRAEKKSAMEEYTPYDIVLEYLLSSEQVATIEEANYVMTEMDAETIQGIVEEQKKKLEEGLPLIAKGAMIVTGGILAKKGLDKAKQSFDNYLNKQRDKGIGGNTRPGSDKMYYGDKKKK